MDIIVDPNIYELSDNQCGDISLQYEHYNYLNNVIDFIGRINKKRHCKLSISITKNQYLSIINPVSHPWTQYKGDLSSNTAIMQLYGDFSKLLNHNEYERLDLSSIMIVNPCEEWSYNTLNENECFNEFLKHINYVKNELREHTFLIGIANNALNTPLNFDDNGTIITIEPIMNVNDVEFSNIYRRLLMSAGYILPTISSPLPNVEWCTHYIDLQNDLIKKGQNKIDVYRKVVSEVAYRNGYIKDDRLSRINSTTEKIRDIYANGEIYISADVRHGRVEVFNSLGHHQGEYTYDNEYHKNSKDETGRHNIIV